MGKDSFRTGSGLIDNYVHEVTEAWFGTNPEGADPNRVYLWMRGAAFVDGELYDEAYESRYSIGNGWEIVEDGAEVEHGNGPGTVFNRNSGIGRVINAIRDLGDDAIDLMASDHDPWQAAMWANKRYTMERRNFGTMKTEDGGLVDIEVPVPVAVEALDATPAKASGGRGRGRAKAADTPAKSSRRGGASEGSGGGGNSRKVTALRKKLHDFIIDKAYEDDDAGHGAFVEEVMEAYPQLNDDEYADLYAEALNPESDLWAAAMEELDASEG